MIDFVLILIMPLTENLPKPLAKLNGKPILHYVLNHLKDFDVKKVTVSVGYQSHKIIHYLSSQTFPWKTEISDAGDVDIIYRIIKVFENSKINGLVVGVSGGVDSALTSTLCAETGKKLICIEMPIKQEDAQISRAKKHIEWLKSKYSNVTSIIINLDSTYNTFVDSLPKSESDKHDLSLANTRSRLRMVTLYYFAALNNFIVAGTGNKVEDFGIGFYTKYGDGGVDISPIADLLKSEVFELARYHKIIDEIISAKPTDGLWNDNRTDEEQIGATYDELEKAMLQESKSDINLSQREIEVMSIYKSFNSSNRHKMDPIPVCAIPKEYI